MILNYYGGCGRVYTDSGEILVEVSPSIGIIVEISGVKYFKYISDSLPVWVRLDMTKVYSTQGECERAYFALDKVK